MLLRSTLTNLNWRRKRPEARYSSPGSLREGGSDGVHKEAGFLPVVLLSVQDRIAKTIFFIFVSIFNQ